LLFHSKTKDDTLSILETDLHTGLTSQKVDEFQGQYGPNKLEEKKTKTLKSRKLTRAFIRKLAEDKGAAKLELLKLFPQCQFNDIDIRQTPYTKGYYLYRRLKIISDSGG